MSIRHGSIPLCTFTVIFKCNDNCECLHEETIHAICKVHAHSIFMNGNDGVAVKDIQQWPIPPGSYADKVALMSLATQSQYFH